MTQLIEPAALIRLDVFILVITAFLMAWICRQMLAETHGGYAVIFRLSIAALASIYAVEAWCRLGRQVVPSDLDILRNLTALILVITAIGYHWSSYRRI